MVFGFTRFLSGGRTAPDAGDGFGQSLVDDARFIVRFRAMKRERIAWRTPSEDEAQVFDQHAVIGRFGDDTVAVAGHEQFRLAVRERIWHGWPDPAQFVLFAWSPDGKIWCARDFDRWPHAWTRPTPLVSN